MAGGAVMATSATLAAIPFISKDELRAKLVRIREMGFVKNSGSNGAGAVGETLEHLLGLTTNNLPIPNAGEWELKAQAISQRTRKVSSLTTLLHLEPSPRSVRWVSTVLLPIYGRPHKEAGKLKPVDEKSFRQTIFSGTPSNGWNLCYDPDDEKFLFTGNGLDKDSCPYWNLNELYCHAGTKLKNCIYVIATKKVLDGVNWFEYHTVKLLEHFDKLKFRDAILNGGIGFDFDARTGHNHGTKIRARSGVLLTLYENVQDW